MEVKPVEWVSSAKNESDYLVRQAQEKAMAGDHFTAVKYLKDAIEKYPRNANAHRQITTVSFFLFLYVKNPVNDTKRYYPGIHENHIMFPYTLIF